YKSDTALLPLKCITLTTYGKEILKESHVKAFTSLVRGLLNFALYDLEKEVKPKTCVIYIRSLADTHTM
ncbi:hypothetical protein, partial [Bartonella sp. CL46QHWL]|uniref:hypothetical protein n=1 Tax=Bartonella sp. CL46QHWL TaxID=3243534 RepID=UPI0035CF697B